MSPSDSFFFENQINSPAKLSFENCNCEVKPIGGHIIGHASQTRLYFRKGKAVPRWKQGCKSHVECLVVWFCFGNVKRLLIPWRCCLGVKHLLEMMHGLPKSQERVTAQTDISLRLFRRLQVKGSQVWYIVSGMNFNLMFGFDGSCHQEFFGNNAIWFRLAGRNSDLQGLRLAGRIDWICVARWNYLKLPLTWPLLGDLRQKHHFGCFLKIEMNDYLFWTAADSARIFQRLRLWHVLHVFACFYFIKDMDSHLTSSF